MREKHGRLAGFRQLAGMHLRDQDCQRNGQSDADDDEDQIIRKRIAHDIGQIRRLEKKLEILEPDPFAVEKQTVKKTFAGRELVVFEREDDPKERDIAKRGEPKHRAKRKAGQLKIILRKPPAPLAHRRSERLLRRHGMTHFLLQAAAPDLGVTDYNTPLS